MKFLIKTLDALSLVIIQNALLIAVLYFLAPPPELNPWRIVSVQDCKINYDTCSTIYYSLLYLAGSAILTPLVLGTYVFCCLVLGIYRYFFKKKS